MIDIIYTSASYNSFMDIAEADVLIPNLDILNGVNSGWVDLMDPVKELYLKDATRLINNIDWSGARNSGIIVPIMSWPRSGLTYSTGEIVPDDVIPDEVKNLMACIISSNILYGDPDELTECDAVESKTVDRVTVNFSAAASSGVAVAGVDRCRSKYIPSNWTGVLDSVMGVGSIQKMRRP